MVCRKIYERSINIIRKEGITGYLKAIKRFYNSNLLDISITKELHWYLSRLMSSSNLTEKKILGSKMYLNFLDKGLSKQLFMHGYREPEFTRIIKNELKDGMRVVEIGANIGYYALIEAQIVGDTGRIYAIEPSPSNFQLLERNIDLNLYRNRVKTYDIAISNKNGKGKLYTSDYHNCSSMFKRRGGNILDGICECVDVKTSTLDNFIKDKKPIDFIRMDIEGYEYFVIQGMKKTLHDNNPYKIFMEVHPPLIREMGYKTETMLQIFLDAGFMPKYIVIKYSPVREKSFRYNGPISEFFDYLRDNGLFDRCFSLFMEKNDSRNIIKPNLNVGRD